MTLKGKSAHWPVNNVTGRPVRSARPVRSGRPVRSARPVRAPWLRRGAWPGRSTLSEVGVSTLFRALILICLLHEVDPFRSVPAALHRFVDEPHSDGAVFHRREVEI